MVGQRMAFVDKKHEPAVFQHVAGVGIPRQMIGDAQSQVDLFLVQEGIEDGTGGFRGHDAQLGPGFLEGTVESGENRVSAHGDQTDPQQGFSGAQGTGGVFQLFVLFLEFLGLF